MRKVAMAGVVLCAGLWACGVRLIPGTTIPDTDDNQAIIHVVQVYKAAYEAKDVPAIMEMVSPSFYETNGTADPADDYDYKGLEKILTDQFKAVAVPALDVDIRRIVVKGNDAAVDYYYASRFQLADAGANGGFKTASDVAQMKMHREGGTWKFVSGI